MVRTVACAAIESWELMNALLQLVMVIPIVIMFAVIVAALMR